jgi:hypothetical protein
MSGMDDQGMGIGKSPVLYELVLKPVRNGKLLLCTLLRRVHGSLKPGSLVLLADRPVLGRKRLSQMPTDSIYRSLYDLGKAGYPPIRNCF